MATFTRVTMYKKPYHYSPLCDRQDYPPGQPVLWAGNPRPITPTLAQLCHNRGVPDMDAFSRLQLEANTGKIFNGPKDIPTMLLTKGYQRDWLGDALKSTPTIFQPWQHHNEDTHFMTAYETGANEFQTLLPVNILKKGRNRYSPPNGMVVTRVVHTPGPLNQGTKYMLSLLEGTLLGTAAGTRTTGRALIMCQMQMPKKHREANNSKIRALSDTLEIIYEGTYKLPPKETEMPVNIIITLTW